MDKYEQLSVVGEGSYGVVLKCRRRDTGQVVAIKKFLETEEDAGVRKMALREIRMLKKLRHDHLVNLIEVFRRKRRFYLVFEYLERTLLDQLEDSRGGLGEDTSKRYLFQLLKGIEYCHQNSIIHRDVKPENVLVSKSGVVKLCDLGFARTLAAPGEPYTEYVATRWYRAPELLVAEHRYGPEVDIWAVGCLFAEMLTGEPLFPGDSDIDQLALIVKTVGKLSPRHQQIVTRLSGGAALPNATGSRASLPGSGHGKEVIAACLRTEPRARPSATVLLRHKYFVADGFAESFNAELRKIMGKHIDSAGPPKINTARVSGKPRQHWTLNGHAVQENDRPRTNSTAGSLIDYNFTNDIQNACTESNCVSGSSIDPEMICKCEREERASSKPTTTKSLVRAINRAFKSFPVPVNAYPRTPYIKNFNRNGLGVCSGDDNGNLAMYYRSDCLSEHREREPDCEQVNNRLVIDSDMLGGTSSRKMKKKTEFTLPFVPGACNASGNKDGKKSTSTKGQHDFDAIAPRSSGIDTSPSAKTLTNLPFMPPP